MTLRQRFGKVVLVVVATLFSFSSAFSPIKPPRSPSIVRLQAESESVPLDDGGQTPSAEEKKSISSIGKNVVIEGKRPLGQKLGISQALLRTRSLFVRDNRLPYQLFEQVRKNTEIEYMVLDQVVFNEKVKDTLFYQTVRSTKEDLLIGTFYGIFGATPYMKPEAGTVDYEELIGPDFFEPYQRTMIAATPEDCFVQQAVAFCNPESVGSNRLVCDLKFMEKYQVNELTRAGRYGANAVVDTTAGKIVEVDGITETSSEFESYKAKFLSSFGVYLVVLRHAVMTHLAISQRLLVKLTTDRQKGFVDTWQDNRGPYTLLRALTTRTNEVSINEQLLIGPNRSLVQRATSFTPDSLELMCADFYDKYAAMTPDEVIADVANSGTGKWTIAVKRAWEGAKKVVNEICQRILNDHVKQSDLEDLALMLWVATFYHGFIGDFQLDSVNQGKLMLLHTGETEIPKSMELSYGTLSTTIGVSTMTRTLQCQTLGAYFPEKSEQEAWGTYMDLLASLDVGVEGFSLATPVYAAVNF